MKPLVNLEDSNYRSATTEAVEEAIRSERDGERDE